MTTGFFSEFYLFEVWTKGQGISGQFIGQWKEIKRDKGGQTAKEEYGGNGENHDKRIVFEYFKLYCYNVSHKRTVEAFQGKKGPGKQRMNRRYCLHPQITHRVGVQSCNGKAYKNALITLTALWLVLE